MPEVNEFQLGIDMSAITPPESSSIQSVGDSVVIGTPAPAAEPEPAPTPSRVISVYAQSITPISYSVASDNVACFDVVFSVGIYESGVDDGSKTYQVVKRIGIDKEKIAQEAMQSTPVTVIEEKKPIDNKRSKPSELERFRRIAGLG